MLTLTPEIDFPICAKHVIYSVLFENGNPIY